MDNYQKYDDLLITNAVPVFGFRVVMFLDPEDGSQLYRFEIDRSSDVPVTTVLGVLSLATQDIIQSTRTYRLIKDEEEDTNDKIDDFIDDTDDDY